MAVRSATHHNIVIFIYPNKGRKEGSILLSISLPEHVVNVLLVKDTVKRAQSQSYISFISLNLRG